MHELIPKPNIVHALPYNLVKHILYAPDINIKRRQRMIGLAHNEYRRMRTDKVLFTEAWKHITVRLAIVSRIEKRTPVWAPKINNV